MPAVLRQEEFSGLGFGVDERDARHELRRQISHLERELASLFGDAFGHTEIPHRVQSLISAPRVLDLGELEAVRDSLAQRIGEARSALSDRSVLETRNRELLREMLDRPEEFKWLRISRADVGEPGCGAWHSRPLLGPLGMLMGWWRVKVSSGCPLAGRLAAVEHQAEAREAGFRT
ncbi:MAG TPA: hypothetical protein VFL77_06650 [Solirubrobacterales bacterium]|nr:hypothetical protein [Solirubrobacterales bacterium]